MTKPTPVITKPKQALDLYLEDLLLQVPEILDQEEQDIFLPQADELSQQAPAEPVPGSLVESQVAMTQDSSSQTAVAPPEDLAIKAEKAVDVAVEAADVQPESEALVVANTEGLASFEAYDWQAEEFDCLLFQVAGLNLAIPMVMLGTIHTKTELTSLFGQPDWLLGLMKLSESSSLRLVDTARIFLEHRYLAQHSHDFRYVIGVYGTNWGLACHQVLGSKRIAKSQVKWREQRTSRPWLAGTIKEEMCALIDVQALCQFRLK